MRAMKLRGFETRDQELPMERDSYHSLGGISVEKARWSVDLSVQVQMGNTNNQMHLAPRRA